VSGSKNRFSAVAQPFQRKADMGHPCLSLDGQRDGTRPTVKQACAKVFFQLPDPLTHRRLRQTDIFGSGGKTAEPSRRLKGADPFKRWKTIPFHKPNNASDYLFLI
jgi:hypothetical protein